MGQPVRQQAFTGEIAPERYGRTKDPRYATSLRTCKNFLPIEDGALVNRAGTYDMGALAAAQVRFEHFVFTDAQAFVLEFTNLLVRVWTPAGLVLNAGVPVAVATPYLAADLPFLKFQQSGDVITITRRGYQPRDLTRISNTNWTLALRSFTPQAFFAGFPSIDVTEIAMTSTTRWDLTPFGPPPAGYGVGDIVMFQPGGAGPFHLYQSLAGPNRTQPDLGGWTDISWNAGTTYDKGKYVWSNGQPWVSIIEQNKGNDPEGTAGAAWAPASDETRPAMEWKWAVTVLWKDDHGVTRETLPSVVSVGGAFTFSGAKSAVYSDRPATIRWTAPGAQAFSFKLVGYNIYRGRGTLYGFVGGAEASDTSFVDTGAAPDYGTQPPKGTNPFAIADGADSANTFSWPACGTIHAQREVFAGTDKKPSTFFGSAVGDFNRFDVYDPPQDADSYEWRVSSARLEDIRSIISFGRLLLFSGQGVFSAHGADGADITANSVEVRKHVKKGASYLDPLEVANVVLFNTSKGNYVRDLVYDFASNSYTGQDLTRIARHLFRGHTIVSWAHQEEPYSVVWMVRDDGLLISCTYDRDTQTLAWAQHPTAGTVIQVETIPNGTEDAVMLGVMRNGAPRMERMASRDLAPTDSRELCFLDAAITFDGRNVGATTMKVSGAGYDAEAEVTIDASAAAFTDPTDIGDQIIILPDGIAAVLDEDGVELVPAVPPTRATITQVNSPTQALARLETPLPAAYQNAATLLWGWARDAFAGFDHLEGLDVTVLADGSVQGPFTVAGGIIGPLNPPALILVGGLPYVSDAELLDVAADSVKSNVKTVEQVIFEVLATRGLLVGERLDDPKHPMREAKLRKIADNFDPTALATQQVEVKIASTWNTKGGRAAIRQKDPLPLTITAVTRIIDVGGQP
jgi:hypothetical protein